MTSRKPNYKNPMRESEPKYLPSCAKRENSYDKKKQPLYQIVLFVFLVCEFTFNVHFSSKGVECSALMTNSIDTSIVSMFSNVFA